MTGSPTDLELGTFSDDPPWIVDPSALRWIADIDTIRNTTRRRVPSLVSPPRVPPVRRALTVTGRLGLALLRWAVAGRRRGGAESRADLSRRLREAAEALGPTYIKLGQIISSGEGIFPAELVAEFARGDTALPTASAPPPPVPLPSTEPSTEFSVLE